MFEGGRLSKIHISKVLLIEKMSERGDVFEKLGSHKVKFFLNLKHLLFKIKSLPPPPPHPHCSRFGFNEIIKVVTLSKDVRLKFHRIKN